MELKVWVDGVVRVVCGLSLNTSCQDVVIALAQAIGQTGRYILILKLRGTERHLVADDCPLRHLAQLGQLAAEVQFILKRTGPSLVDGQDKPSRSKLPLLPRHPLSEPLKRKHPQKALTFNLGPSAVPRKTNSNRSWSPSPRSSPEPGASPVPFHDALTPVNAPLSYPSKEEVFKQLLKQQRRLQDLESQVEALERETEALEHKGSAVEVLGLEELESLEQRLRQNELDLKHGQQWEEQLRAEVDKEQDMHRSLDQISSSVDNQSQQLKELEAHGVRLEEDIRLKVHKQRSQPSPAKTDKTLVLLKQELDYRQQQVQQFDTKLSKTKKELFIAEEILQIGAG
ncbi:ras association domain-containing protein 8-like isoform X2 [Genypterus blacodes]|uniref:ras association domain-containing protein 8-like isoform X2 n=1 Tax=Genypterus blacodes TaxID=154954 RepID=UPI003F772F8D